MVTALHRTCGGVRWGWEMRAPRACLAGRKKTTLATHSDAWVTHADARASQCVGAAGRMRSRGKFFLLGNAFERIGNAWERTCVRVRSFFGVGVAVEGGAAGHGGMLGRGGGEVQGVGGTGGICDFRFASC